MGKRGTHRAARPAQTQIGGGEIAGNCAAKHLGHYLTAELKDSCPGSRHFRPANPRDFGGERAEGFGECCLQRL